MLLFSLFLTLFFTFLSQATSSPPAHNGYLSNHSSFPFPFDNPFCSPAISLRYPPTIEISNPDWVPPPYAWIFGNWKVRYSSRPAYASLYNFQVDHYPVLPTTPNNAPAQDRVQIDLTSFQSVPSGNATIDDAISTVFGYDTPQPSIAPFVFNFTGTGKLSTVTNDWEILAWGYDQDGNGYRVEYETQVDGPGNNSANTPCINILSRSETGPDTQTLTRIMKDLKVEFQDDTALTEIVTSIIELHVDGRRSNFGPVSCDQACLTNSQAAG